ncbi:hypothetical protein D5H78_08910 [Vallicoccus soli]|uniref:DUF5302 domain-containing protein n=2 Tax=Vallicoccus soli TaxID=2339232 RepID=A0A3A3YZU9_9ACTN|nr:hypothetical protein D5H78_08910 [Vallicoccus soli]
MVPPRAGPGRYRVVPGPGAVPGWVTASDREHRMSTEPTAPAEQVPDPAPAAQGASEPGGAPTPPAQGASGGDDVRRRFEEALERKRHRHGGGAGEEGARRGGAPHASTGPARQQRQFRRKSG